MNAAKPGSRRTLWLVVGGVAVIGALLFVGMSRGDRAATESSVSLRPGSTSGLATDSSPAAPEPGGFDFGGGDIASLAWRLVLVAGIIGVAVIALRWWGKRTSSPRSVTGFLRVVDTLAISNGRSIHLVALGNRVIAVGATASQLTLLSELMDDESATILERDGASSSSQPIAAFAADLFKAMRTNFAPARPGPVSLPEDDFVIGGPL